MIERMLQISDGSGWISDDCISDGIGTLARREQPHGLLPGHHRPTSMRRTRRHSSCDADQRVTCIDHISDDRHQSLIGISA
jgi:hypothetical protein